MHLKLMDGKRRVSMFDAKRYTVTNFPDGTIAVEMGIYEDGAYRLETVRLPDDGDVIYVEDAASGRTIARYRWLAPATTEDQHQQSEEPQEPEIRKEFRYGY